MNEMSIERELLNEKFSPNNVITIALKFPMSVSC